MGMRKSAECKVLPFDTEQSNLVIDPYKQDNEEFERRMNYESANMAAVRPDKYSFQDDSAEFYRWYEYGGKPRLEPLNREELDQLLASIPNAGGPHLAFTAEAWDQFKTDKLGALRGPIETLQAVIRDHDTDATWWELACKAADWCGTSERPDLQKVYDALHGLAVRAELGGTRGEPLPRWHKDVTAARDAMIPNFPEKIMASFNGESLIDAYSCLHELNVRYQAALENGDIEQAEFERYEASRIEQKYPVLKELVRFGEIEPLVAEAEENHNDTGLDEALP